MAAIDVSRRYELERLLGELRLAGRTIRASTIAERRATCESLAQMLRERLEPHAALDEAGLQALDAWTSALDRADPLDVDLLQELLYGIDALVRVHLWRETGFPLEPPEPRGAAEALHPRRNSSTFETPASPSRPLDRLEGRVDYQASRIDALYAMLEEGGIPSVPPDADGAGDALFDELLQIEDAPFAHEKHARPMRRARTRLRVGNATGV